MDSPSNPAAFAATDGAGTNMGDPEVSAAPAEAQTSKRSPMEMTSQETSEPSGDAPSQFLRPPSNQDEKWLISKLPNSLQGCYNSARVWFSDHMPCAEESEYLLVELESDKYWSPTDLVLVGFLSLLLLPFYFGWWEWTFGVIRSFLVNRLLIPGYIVAVRTRKLPVNRITLLLIDVCGWIMVWGGLYGEIGAVIEMVGWEYSDDVVQRFEQYQWTAQPAVAFSQEWPFKLLGEYFHFCYFFFYGIAVLPVLVTYWFHGRKAYIAIQVAYAMCYSFCSLIWVFFPCQGPYWTLDHHETSEMGWFFPYITRFFVEGGSSHGTATPSSHCATATIAWTCVIWFTGRYHWWFLTTCPGLWLATVYGCFHYVFDVELGIIIGMGIFLVVITAVPRYLDWHEYLHANRKDFADTSSLADMAERAGETAEGAPVY